MIRAPILFVLACAFVSGCSTLRTNVPLDNSATWRDQGDAARAFLVTADPVSGLQVKTRDGAQRGAAPATGLHHIDLKTLRDGTVLVVASDRADPSLAFLFLAILNPATGELGQVSRVPVGAGVATDVCIGMQQDGGGVEVYSPMASGSIFRTTVARSGTGWSGLSLKPFSVPGRATKCLVPKYSETLYVGQQNAGIWRFSPASPDGTLILRTDGGEVSAADWAELSE